MVDHHRRGPCVGGLIPAPCHAAAPRMHGPAVTICRTWSTPRGDSADAAVGKGSASSRAWTCDVDPGLRAVRHARPSTVDRPLALTLEEPGRFTAIGGSSLPSADVRQMSVADPITPAMPFRRLHRVTEFEVPPLNEAVDADGDSPIVAAEYSTDAAGAECLPHRGGRSAGLAGGHLGLGRGQTRPVFTSAGDARAPCAAVRAQVEVLNRQVLIGTARR